MTTDTDNQNDWGARKIFLAAMLSQVLGTNTIVILPQQAVVYGAAGHMMLYAVIYIFIGIPLLYMEYVTGQFTGRDCLEVWKARRCVSHVGYVQIFWQVVHVIINHSFCSFVLHYFLTSFENPIPYYVCGYWSNSDCDILYRNYTIHQDCLSSKERLPYCADLCTTFPEYQYWRFFILRLNRDEFYLAWHVTMASMIICVTLYLSFLRRVQSVKWVLGFYTIFIICGRFLFLIGSMLQKGVVVKFEDALDTNLSVFIQYMAVPACVVEVLLSLNVGSGIGFNLASRTSFRSPCYSNTVVVVVVSAAMTILGISSCALMLCPYSFKHGVNPLAVAKYPIFVTYEMIPRLLFAYESHAFWLILNFSYIGLSCMCVNTIIIWGWLEILAKRYSTAAKYPGLTTVLVVLALYIFSFPLLGNKSLHFTIGIKRAISFLLTFSVVIECFVFLICYGFERFSEDVHFMLGVQPMLFVKISWIVSIFVLSYVFCFELYAIYMARRESMGSETGCWLLITVMTLTLLVVIGKILGAFIKKRLHDEICLDPKWGPKSEVLQRSRAMFTTHAMTKEYIYRQYHLQAGILMRQRICNIRN